jgi:hypothetical protein
MIKKSYIAEERAERKAAGEELGSSGDTMDTDEPNDKEESEESEEDEDDDDKGKKVVYSRNAAQEESIAIMNAMIGYANPKK